jgi:hypothetical protein
MRRRRSGNELAGRPAKNGKGTFAEFIFEYERHRSRTGNGQAKGEGGHPSKRRMGEKERIEDFISFENGFISSEKVERIIIQAL